MLDLLDRLRGKPERVRFSIALTVAAFITGIIFIVGFSVVKINVTTQTDGSENSKQEEQKSGIFSSLGVSMKRFYEQQRIQVGLFFDGLGTIRYEDERVQ